MITFTVEPMARDQFAVYEVRRDGRRGNCRAVVGTAAEAEACVARFTATEERIAARPREELPEDVEFCWECGGPIVLGDGVLDVLGWAHRSCVGG